MFKFNSAHMLTTKLVIGLGLLLSVNIASANVILTFDSTSFSSNNPATGASATAELSFSNTAGGVLIDFNFQNTTGLIAPFGEGATASKLTGVAIDLFTPNTGTGGFVPGAFLDTLIQSANAQPFGTVDIGIISVSH